MKLTLVLVVFCALSSGLAQRHRHEAEKRPTEAVASTPAPPPTLAQDLDELYRFVPTRPLYTLSIRYLLNDAEFQSFVRAINSPEAFFASLRFRSRPEVMMFLSWVRQQILASGGQFEYEESEELLTVFNKSPFWSKTVSGWAGFVNEFMAYYPQDMIKIHINTKVQQGGIFAQFWQRVKDLKPIYDNALNYPETKKIIAQLQAGGIDTNQIDTFIRTQFDWLEPIVANTTAAPLPAVSEGPVAPVDPADPAAPVEPVAAPL